MLIHLRKLFCNYRSRGDTNEETPERGVVSVAIEGLYQNEADTQVRFLNICLNSFLQCFVLL